MMLFINIKNGHKEGRDNSLFVIQWKCDQANTLSRRPLALAWTQSKSNKKHLLSAWYGSDTPWSILELLFHPESNPKEAWKLTQSLLPLGGGHAGIAARQPEHTAGALTTALHYPDVPLGELECSWLTRQWREKQMGWYRLQYIALSLEDRGIVSSSRDQQWN